MADGGAVMPDREKVIDKMWKFVKVCAIYGDDEAVETIREAVVLLKEQEPRVMTFEELYVDSDESVICYIEFRDKDVINVTAPFRYPGDNLIQIPYIGTDYRKWVELKQYGKTWRCWTSRPSDEQRENTPWEPPKEEDRG